MCKTSCYREPSNQVQLRDAPQIVQNPSVISTTVSMQHGHIAVLSVLSTAESFSDFDSSAALSGVLFAVFSGALLPLFLLRTTTTIAMIMVTTTMAPATMRATAIILLDLSSPPLTRRFFPRVEITKTFLASAGAHTTCPSDVAALFLHQTRDAPLCINHQILIGIVGRARHVVLASRRRHTGQIFFNASPVVLGHKT